MRWDDLPVFWATIPTGWQILIVLVALLLLSKAMK
jgi:hypothetical protein